MITLGVMVLFMYGPILIYGLLLFLCAVGLAYAFDSHK